MDYTYQIRLRRGTSSQWSISNPILASGEPGLATDLNYYKIGDGVTPWNDLPWTTGLKGDSASVTAGETITGAPGSSADVTNSGTELNAIFDFVIPEGMPGKDLVVHEGDRDDPPSDWTNQQFLWDPNGEIHEEVPLTEAETDARYISKSLLTAKGDLMARDASTTVRVPVGQDGQLLTADSSALQGMAWKPNEAYSKAVSDARYEKKLLTQAVAWYDAGNVGADRLLDLSGNGRDAVFGAGAAAPVVLPYDGEPYVYYPQQTYNGFAGLAGGGTPTSTVTAVLRRKWEWATGYSQQFFQVGSGVRYLLQVSAGGTVLSSIWVGAPTVISGNKPVPTKEWIRITLNCATGEALCEQSDDGTLWVTLFTASHGKPPAFDSSLIYIGGGSADHSAPGRLYSARINFDGQDVAILDPRNVNADYTKIRNTGTAGGDWTIQRATTGFKTAVVDRPLLLFGGGQYADGSDLRSLNRSDHSVVLAMRAHAGTYNWSKALSNTVATDGWSFHTNTTGEWARNYVVRNVQSAGVYRPVSGQAVLAGVISGTEGRRFLNGVRDQTFAVAADRPDASGRWVIGAESMYGAPAPFEFIAAAIFDRALTDAEVAQASAELLDTPHYAQADPHPQYLRQRLTRPNLDDRLVETWDGSKWVATYYDTGLRDVRSLLVNGWTASIATLLRIGRKVTMVVYLDPTAATSDIFFVPPVGFEPVHLGVSAPGVGSATSVNLIEVSGQQLRSVFHTATQVYYCRIDWETAPTVPTSLPGTLISAAP